MTTKIQQRIDYLEFEKTQVIAENERRELETAKKLFQIQRRIDINQRSLNSDKIRKMTKFNRDDTKLIQSLLDERIAIETQIRKLNKRSEIRSSEIQRIETMNNESIEDEQRRMLSLAVQVKDSE